MEEPLLSFVLPFIFKTKHGKGNLSSKGSPPPPPPPLFQLRRCPAMGRKMVQKVLLKASSFGTAVCEVEIVV